MNLQPFYDLRERLLVSAAAGTQFVQEDFRLREAVKKMEVFAKASPVFARMSQMLAQLLDGEKEKKTETLLDVLGLLDAFLTTQGVSQMEGNLLPAVEEGRARLPLGDEQSSYQEIPYSRLQPIKWALTETGSSRQSTLEENYKLQPELFMDFRICPLMIQALNDPYAEIGEMVCGWLIKIGEPVIPLLKEGFNPKGKKEMVRRVRAISEIAGAAENDFYCAQIPESEKEVKEALIRALRYSQENQPFLFELLKTERGKMKTTVQWVLGFMEGEEVSGYWKKRASAAPVETADLLRYAKTSYAPAILAEIVRTNAEDLIRENEERAKQNKEEKKSKTNKQEEEKLRARSDQLVKLIYGCTGKTGREIEEMLEWAAAQEGLKSHYVIFATMMADTILKNPLASKEAEDYCRLAERFFAQYGREYARPAFAASLLMKSSEETYDRFSGSITSMGYSIFRVLQTIRYQEDIGYFVYTEAVLDDRGTEIIPEQIHVLEQGLDLRWYPLIMENRKHCPDDYFEVGTSFQGANAVLYRLFRKDIPQLCQQYGEYFYHLAITAEPNVGYTELLVRCGWTKFDGILFQAAKKNAWVYQLRMLINVLPISREQLTKELEMIQKLWEDESQKKTKPRNVSSALPTVKKWLEILHNGGTVYELV